MDKKQDIVIVDYGMGNLHSVKKKMDRMHVNISISYDSGVILKADKLILPGVGHFGKAMENLQKLNLVDILNEAVLEKKTPILGICLGMQLMAKSSEEGNVEGFGWFDGQVKHFKVADQLKYKVPHTGWNQVEVMKESKLMHGIDSGAEMYFVHSYHFAANDQKDVLNETIYEERFVSAIEKNNIFGVQYHPEKSHEIGEKMIGNFVNL